MTHYLGNFQIFFSFRQILKMILPEKTITFNCEGVSTD